MIRRIGGSIAPDCERSHERSHSPEPAARAPYQVTKESPVSASENPTAEQYVIGVDFGTLSGRAVVVRVSDGEELASATLDYPHAVMDTTLAATGAALPPEWALQVASDYVDVLKSAIPEAV